MALLLMSNQKFLASFVVHKKVFFFFAFRCWYAHYEHKQPDTTTTTIPGIRKDTSTVRSCPFPPSFSLSLRTFITTSSISIMMKRFLLFLAMLLISSGFSLTLPAGPKLSVVGKSRNDNAKKHVRFLTTCVAATAASTKKTVPTSTKLLNSVFNKKNTVTWLLAFMAGFMNIVCSIRFGSPVLMMTGNYIALGRSLAKQAWIDVSFLLCLVINYCSGFVFSRAIESNVAKTTITSATVLALFAMADAVAFKFPGSRWQGN